MFVNVLSFQGHTPWSAIQNPSYYSGFGSITVRDHAFNIMNPLFIRDDGGYVGLSAGWFTQIDLEEDVGSVELFVSNFSEPPIVECFDRRGILIGSAPVYRPGSTGKIGFFHNGIARLILRSPSNETNLLFLQTETDAGQRLLGFTDAAIAPEAALSKDICAEVIFGETSTLRAPVAEVELADGRDFIAAVAYARYLKDPTRFAPRKRPTDADLRNPTIEKHWNLCKASAVRGEKLAIGNCLHFVIWPINAKRNGPTETPKISDKPGDQWPYTEMSKIARSFGPLENYSYPKSSETYIFKYCGVP